MRKTFAKLHLWLSIPFGILIAIICITGALLVFEQEILQLCHPSRYFVKEAKAETLPIDRLMASARQQLPENTPIRGIRVFQDPERSYQILLPGKKAAAFIDPYTGSVVGMDDGQGFFTQVMRLHRWLLDTPKRDGSFAWGKNIVGYATLAMAIILVSGLVIWWPRSRKMLKNRLQVKCCSGRFRFWHDLHVAGGFYAFLLLLAMALTGLTWSFSWYNQAFCKVFGVEAAARKAHGQSAGPSGGRSQDSGSGKQAQGQMQGPQQGQAARSQDAGTALARTTDYTHWTSVLAQLQRRYGSYKSITLQDGSASVSTARYGNTRSSDRYSFNPENGEITSTQLYKDLPKNGKIRGWIYSVHTGSWGGLATRILSCIAALLGGILALTGYYFWCRKMRMKKKSEPWPNPAVNPNRGCGLRPSLRAAPRKLFKIGVSFSTKTRRIEAWKIS